jgi:hypothetical protein
MFNRGFISFPVGAPEEIFVVSGVMWLYSFVGEVLQGYS